MTRRDGAAREDLRRAYRDAVMEIALPTGRVAVTSAPLGTADGRFPSGLAHLHVITASNPYSRVLDGARNAGRNTALARDLDAVGLAHLEAVGRSPDGRWQEASFAVLDADEEAVLDLADRYDQHAVYAWTPRHLAVVWAGRHRGERDVSGWRVAT